MTREEAIKQLKQIIAVASKMERNEKEIDAFDEEAINMAIKALEQESKEYEKSQNEIKVGDEVYLSDEHYPRVVTCIIKVDNEKTKAVQLTQSGKWVTDDVTELHKTGRHFDQIEEVLKALKGE